MRRTIKLLFQAGGGATDCGSAMTRGSFRDAAAPQRSRWRAHLGPGNVGGQREVARIFGGSPILLELAPRRSARMPWA
jgi:hypothetical protein